MSLRRWTLWTMITLCLAGCLGPLRSVDIKQAAETESPGDAGADVETVSPDDAVADVETVSPDDASADVETVSPDDVSAIDGDAQADQADTEPPSKIVCPIAPDNQWPQSRGYALALRYDGVDATKGSVTDPNGLGVEVVVDNALGRSYVYLYGTLNFEVATPVTVVLKNDQDQTVDSTTCTVNVVETMLPALICPTIGPGLLVDPYFYLYSYALNNSATEVYVGFVGDPTHEFDVDLTAGSGTITPNTFDSLGGTGGLRKPDKSQVAYSKGVARFQGQCVADEVLNLTFRVTDTTAVTEVTKTCTYYCSATPAQTMCCEYLNVAQETKQTTISVAFCAFLGGQPCP